MVILVKNGRKMARKMATLANKGQNESRASKQSGPGWLELVGDTVRRKSEASHTCPPTSSSQPDQTACYLRSR